MVVPRGGWNPTSPALTGESAEVLGHSAYPRATARGHILPQRPRLAPQARVAGGRVVRPDGPHGRPEDQVLGDGTAGATSPARSDPSTAATAMAAVSARST